MAERGRPPPCDARPAQIDPKPPADPAAFCGRLSTSKETLARAEGHPVRGVGSICETKRAASGAASIYRRKRTYMGNNNRRSSSLEI